MATFQFSLVTLDIPNYLTTYVLLADFVSSLTGPADFAVNIEGVAELSQKSRY